MSCISERRLENIGYISGILGPNLEERDWQSIFRQTVDFGYSEIEIGNYLGESASSFLAFCSDIGLKPVEVLKRYPGRYRILHVKDMAPGEEQDFVCPGDGIIEWEPVFAESVNQGIAHFNVEKDNAEDGLGCLHSASQYLKGLRF